MALSIEQLQGGKNIVESIELMKSTIEKLKDDVQNLKNEVEELKKDK